MISETRMLGLIGRVYEAAEDLTIWPQLLEEVGDCVGGAACGLTVYDADAHRTSVALAARLDPGHIQEYSAYYYRLDLFTNRGRRIERPGHALASHTYVTDGELTRSEYFNDFLKKQSLFYNIAASVAVGENTTAFFTALRSKGAGPFNESEESLLNTLLPHLSRAARLQAKLRASEISHQALDSLRASVVFLDRAGKVRYLNRAAKKILAEDDGLRLTSKGVTVASADEGRIFAELCAAAGAPRTLRLPRNICPVTRPSGKLRYLLEVIPARSSGIWDIPGAASCVVWISDPEKRTTSDDHTLRALFGLTPAELRLVALLTADADLTEACECLGISRNTARTQLQSIFQKMGVARQSELISLVARTCTPAHTPD